MFTCDLHVHSPYSYGASKHITPKTLIKEANKRGIDIIGTGDILNTQWEKEIRSSCSIEDEVFTYDGVVLIPTVEVNCVWVEDKKRKQAHVLLVMPVKAVVEVRKILKPYVPDKSNGRPDVSLSPNDLKPLLPTNVLFIFAHVLTPHFGIMGEKCGWAPKQVAEICPDALETGISSTREMLGRIKEISHIPFVSFSDAHSTKNLGREFTVISNFRDGKSLYEHITQSIRDNDFYTVEYPPELGKYHLSGHAKCGYVGDGVCPVCGRKVTIGVTEMVKKYANQESEYSDIVCPPVGEEDEDEEAKKRAGIKEFKKATNDALFWKYALRKVKYIPGYDGQYGKVKEIGSYALFSRGEKD